jgi:thymidylate synthase
MHLSFQTANQAFEYLFPYILSNGQEVNGTKQIMNAAFYIENPMDRKITCDYRNWKEDYAEAEWQWYLSGDPNADAIAEKAQIWKLMQDEDGNVNSNYGYQWIRNNQIYKVIDMLKKDPTTRNASVSMYDGKEIDKYSKDTICTYSINFQLHNDKLNMSVLMRSNDLVFGFCNDQYCFSKLQELVAQEVGLPMGQYFHYSDNLHIYKRHWNLKK